MKKNLKPLPDHLVREFHPTMNGDLKPSDIGTGSIRRIWWQCPNEPSHVYPAMPFNRFSSRMPNNCPLCKNRHRQTLVEAYPEIACQWHPTLNGLLTPHDVSRSCGKFAWWVCPRGHEFRATVNQRARGQGCPRCNESKGETAIDKHLKSLGFHYVRQFKTRTCKNVRNLPYDFAVAPDGKMPLLIEFQGSQHYHPNKFMGDTHGFIRTKIRDEIKKKWAEDHGIPLLEIPFWRIDEIPDLIDEAIGKLPNQRRI